MDLPNVKDILKIVLEKLSILKNNVSLLIPVIIIFISLLLFIPTQLLSSSLRKNVEQNSIAKGVDDLNRLKNKVVSPEQLKAEKEGLEVIQNDANEIIKLSIQTTQRKLLSDEIFTKDSNDINQSIFYEFATRFCSKIDGFVKEIKAGECPTETELNSEVDASQVDSLLQSGTLSANRNSTSINAQDEIKGIIIDQLCQKRAESISLYVDPYQIAGYEFWKFYDYTSLEADIENCWYGQLAYWVIEDVFDTIVQMNGARKDLMAVPVKRLMNIDFMDGDSAGSGETGGYINRPVYLIAEEDVPKETLSGRYSNENYDVIHFSVTFVVRTQDYLKLAEKLCSAKYHQYTDKAGNSHAYKHNQITILGVDMRSVDFMSEDHKYYRYGDENVSELKLDCEYIFNRVGYEDILPSSILDYLNGEYLYEDY